MVVVTIRTGKSHYFDGLHIESNDEMNLMCIYSAGSSRAGLMQKLTEMKKYLERDEVQLLSLTESTLRKLGTMTDEEFGQLELYPDFDI